MNPLIYKRRTTLSLRKERGTLFLISLEPLNVLKIKDEVQRLIELADGQKTISEISERIGIKEEETFRLCEYLRRRGIFELSGVKAEGNKPFVSVIIPVKDREEDLFECLDSIISQSYPKDRMEIIVVDDGSEKKIELKEFAFVRLLRNEKTRGQSYCRNIGVREAKGEILAFIDSDCTAGRTWLEELIPYFSFSSIGAVGGYVDGYFSETHLDRYEKVFSPLFMGNKPFFGLKDFSMTYLPFCNLLVRKHVYTDLLGIREELYVGEDVDFCLRMREKGHLLLYVPYGGVKHKHRRRLKDFAKRRFDYGSSEAILYTLHKEKKKTFFVLPFPFLSLIFLFLAILLPSPFFPFFSLLFFFSDFFKRKRRISRYLSSFFPLFSSLFRVYLSFFYFFSHYILRYYFLLLFPLSFLYRPFLFFCLFLFFFVALFDYGVKKPKVPLPSHLFFYLIDHLFYQLGLLYGCLKKKTLLPFRVSFKRNPS